MNQAYTQTTIHPNNHTPKQPYTQTAVQPYTQTTIHPNSHTPKQPYTQTPKQPYTQTVFEKTTLTRIFRGGHLFCIYLHEQTMYQCVTAWEHVNTAVSSK